MKMLKQIVGKNEINYPHKISQNKADRLFEKGLIEIIDTIYTPDNVYYKNKEKK